MPVLLITVRFHDGRYHGRPDWPPSPARLFQALVAGAGRGRELDDVDADALRWLEKLAPPVIAAPFHRPGQGFSNFVPNNDLDAVGGDPANVGKIRTAKQIKPVLFDAETPLHYVWTLNAGDDQDAKRVCAMAERLYQLGRGVDMAWATGDIVDDEQAETQIRAYDGMIHRPGGATGQALAAPMSGTLCSLIARHQHQRFEHLPSNRTTSQVFRQPPKPLLQQIAYDSPPKRLLFDLVGDMAPVTLTDIVELTRNVRDAAAQRLSEALPDWHGEIERCLVGRGADEADKLRRISILPLPSIGHPHVSPAIRRVLVNIPAACPLRVDDLAWAFSGLEVVSASMDQDTGEITEQLTLSSATDRGMFRHYGIGEANGQRLWRTVTPLALPVSRRRIDPARRVAGDGRPADVKSGSERSEENKNAAASLRQALRQAGVQAEVGSIRLQCEPFSGKGARAEAFEPDNEVLRKRFSKHRLWHAEILLSAPQMGPLIIGDGRYLGLGLMAPVGQGEGILAFKIEVPSSNDFDHDVLTRALRRAVMARIADRLDRNEPLSAFFSGHERDGTPARSGRHRHLAYVYDPKGLRLLILAPHILERRTASRFERQSIATLEQAVSGLSDLRAGVAGRLRLSTTAIDTSSDDFFEPNDVWESVTPFRVTRHAKINNARSALSRNLLDEVRLAGLPDPEIDVLALEGGLGTGLAGRVRLKFRNAVAGPILLGRNKHFGGGAFIGGVTR